MRYIDFKNILRDSIWAGGEAENLLKQHDNMFLEAMSELQNGVEYERNLNVDVVPFNSTWYRGGLTVINKGVPGKVTSLYTIGNCKWNDPVWYHQADPMEPQKWAHNLELFSKGKENPGWPKLPLGFRAADPSTDRLDIPNNAGEHRTPVAGPRIGPDGETTFIPTPNEISGTPGDTTLSNCRRWQRARCGIWSWSSRDIHIAPWINSNEMVVIEWTGIKKSWGDQDIVSDEIDVAKFVKLYVQYAHERDFGDKNEMREFERLWKECLADIIHERKHRERRTRTENMEWRARYAHELAESSQHWDGDDTTPAPQFQSNLVQVHHGIGSPQGTVQGLKGDIYIDDSTQAFYWNGNGRIDGWKP